VRSSCECGIGRGPTRQPCSAEAAPASTRGTPCHRVDGETGLLLANQCYDPGSGRFLNRNPLSYAGGINLYGYVGGNPVNFADPLGLLTGQQGVVLGSAVYWGVVGFYAGGPAGAAIGFGAGAALGAYLVSHNPGAAANAGFDVACTAITVVELGSAAGSVLPRGGQLCLPLEEAGPEVEAAGAEGLAARASEVHGVLDERAQGGRTTAVLQTNLGNIVGGGKRDLDPVQRAMLEGGEISAKLKGAHAEITVLTKAEQLGATPLAIGTSRPFCDECRAELCARGATITGPMTAVWPKQ
jgi:RHS repeat-associated protein